MLVLVTKSHTVKESGRGDGRLGECYSAAFAMGRFFCHGRAVGVGLRQINAKILLAMDITQFMVTCELRRKTQDRDT